MKAFSTLLMLVVLTGCGAYRDNEFDAKRRFEPNEFSQYVSDFEQDAYRISNQRLVINNLIIRFGEEKDFKPIPKGVIAGICYYYSTPLILINPVIWDNSSELRRQALMYHEMGHCVLMREHVPAEEKLSIMNPRLLSESVLKAEYDPLIEELFTLEYYGSHYDFTLHEGDHDCG